MKWYEMIGLMVIWVLGLYRRAKFYESMKDYFYNDRWRTGRKK